MVNKNFIASNYCVNKDKPSLCCEGSCFLGEKLEKTNDNSFNNIPTKVKIEKTEDTFFERITNQFVMPLNAIKCEYTNIFNFHSYNLLKPVFHPPNY